MVILENVGISTIVRDEIMNPAGGIEKFVHAHAPFVAQIVIQDTGSIDGTYEKLKELKKNYSNLIIPEPIEFTGYADARNYCLNFLTKEFTLVLDADELITHKKPQNNWEELKLALNSVPKNFYWIDSFTFSPLHICPDKNYNNDSHHVSYNSQRLFRSGSIKYYGDIFEDPSIPEIEDEEYIPCIQSAFLGVALYHFLPSYEARLKKEKEWYKRRIYSKKDFSSNIKHKISPSQTKGFSEWKQYNSKRDNYE